MIQNHGFIPDQIKSEDYLLGGYTKVSGEILQPDGSWLNFLPIIERQERDGVETYSCVSFGTLNCLEMLIKRLWQKEENYSDRYLAIASNTTIYGNSPQNVAEILRKTSGCVDDKLLPFSEDIQTFDEYHSPKPLPEDLTNKGKKWLEKWEVKHEFAFQDGEDKKEKLKMALQRSPVGVSVLAWQQDENGTYIKPAGTQDNHYVVLVGYDENKYWIIFDSYPVSDGAFLKKLSWDYDFGMAKVYYLKKNEKVGFWQKIKNYLISLYARF